MYFLQKTNQKKARVAILTSDKIDFQSKTVIRDKEQCYMKGSIEKEDITIINIYSSNIRVRKYIKRILTELTEEIAIQ